MSKEKQIKEMAKVMAHDRFCEPNEYQIRLFFRLSEALYNAGYRKQSENVIELPCKVGDTVYIIDEGDGECAEDYVLGVEVLQFFINKHGIAVDLKLPLGLRLNTWAVFGKNVFLTREEAEKALKEREGK